MQEKEEIFPEEIHNEETPNNEYQNKSEDEVKSPPSAEEMLAEEKNRYLRLFAEFDNFKKRTSKEKMEYFQYASQDLMIAMLSILDDFERAIKNLKEQNDDSQLQGVELIYQKFKNLLFEKGLQTIDVNVGDKFDVDLHEAITQIPAPSEDLKGKIVDVIETGYQLKERVIRFTKVIIGQ